jgi:hypothetical protein
LSGHNLPTMYHFHGLRFISDRLVVGYSGYDVGKARKIIYPRYISALANIISLYALDGSDMPVESKGVDFYQRIRVRILEAIGRRAKFKL